MFAIGRMPLVVLAAAVAFFVVSPQFDQSRAAEPEVKEEDATAKPTKEMQQIARLSVANELMRLHWTKWITDQAHAKTIRETAKGIDDQLEVRPRVEYLLPDVKAERKQFDEFEKQATDDIRAGVPEVWRDTPDGAQYLRGIRAAQACVLCHQTLGARSGELKEGDLLGIISMKLDR